MCPGLWAAAIVEGEEAVPQLEEAGDQQLDGSVIAAAPVPREGAAAARVPQQEDQPGAEESHG